MLLLKVTYVRTHYVSAISQKAQIEYYLISEKLFIVQKVTIKCNLIKMSSTLLDIFDYDKYLMQLKSVWCWHCLVCGNGVIYTIIEHQESMFLLICYCMCFEESCPDVPFLPN